LDKIALHPHFEGFFKSKSKLLQAIAYGYIVRGFVEEFNINSIYDIDDLKKEGLTKKI
jgi:hypothetical protein